MQVTKTGKNLIQITVDLDKDRKTLKTGKQGYYERFLLKRNGTNIRLQILGWILQPKAKNETVVTIGG